MRRLAVCTLLLLMLVPGGGVLTAQTVVATVGGEPIDQRQVDRLLKEATAGRTIDPAAEALVRAQVLEEIIRRRLVLAYARRTGSGAAEAEIRAALDGLKSKLQGQGRSLETYLQDESLSGEDLEHRIEWRLTWQKFLARYVTDARIEAHFHANRRQLDGTELAVSQILLKPEGTGPTATDAVLEKAEAIRRSIVSGEVSFAEAARRHSIAPSAEDGGRLGFIARRGAMDEAFARTAFTLAVGQVSEPVRTRFGVHLIRCDGLKPGSKGPADVREEIVEALARELMEKLARVETETTPVAYPGAAPHFQPGTGELVVPRP